MYGDSPSMSKGQQIESIVVTSDCCRSGGAGVEKGGLVLLPEALLAGEFFLGVGGLEGLQSRVGKLHPIVDDIIILSKKEIIKVGRKDQ